MCFLLEKASSSPKAFPFNNAMQCTHRDRIQDKMWIKCWRLNLKYFLKAHGFKVHNISLRKIKPTKKLCDAKTAQVTHLTTSKTKSLPAMLRQPRERCHLWNSVGCETMWVSSQHGLAFLPSSSPNKALYSNSKLYWKQNAVMMDGRQWSPDLLWSDFTLKYNIQLNNDVLFQVQRLMSNTELLWAHTPPEFPVHHIISRERCLRLKAQSHAML